MPYMINLYFARERLLVVLLQNGIKRTSVYKELLNVTEYRWKTGRYSAWALPLKKLGALGLLSINLSSFDSKQANDDTYTVRCYEEAMR
jgi:hypothetical protein